MKRGIFFSSLFLLLACGEVVAPTESDAGLVSTIDGGSFVNSDASTPVGGLNQMCYPNGTCNADFSCVDNLCEEEVACPAPTIIYLNKLGGVFGHGSPESAVYNTSLMFNVVPQNLAEWAPSTSAVWDDIVATFENVLSEFNIDVVTNDPGNIDHYEIVITTDSPAEFFELPASFAPETLAVMVSPGCLQSQRVAFVFPKSIGVSEVTLPHYLLKATGLMIGASFSLTISR